MTMEEEFDRWWRDNHSALVRMPFDSEIWLAAFRLGHHQGMTRAAEIAKGNMPAGLDPIGPLHGAGRAFSAKNIEQDILTERDKS